MKASRARLLVPTLLVLMLVGLVAVAATGSTTAGSGRTRPPATIFVNTIVSLFVVAVLAGLVLLGYGVLQWRSLVGGVATRRRRRRLELVWFLLFVTLFTFIAYLRLRSQDFAFRRGDGASTLGPSRDAQVDDQTQDVEFAWIPVLAIVSVLALALVARRRLLRGAGEEETENVAESLAETLDDTIDDLRAHADPRRAVIAAYGRMERSLAAFGLPRRAFETSAEYLARILAELDVEHASVLRLSDLYARAKFSDHEVDVAMREEAIATLERVRDELTSADERRRSEASARIPGAAPA